MSVNFSEHIKDSPIVLHIVCQGTAVVCVCVWTITFELNGLWTTYLAYWFIPRDAVLAQYMPKSCVCLLSQLTSWCSTETAKHRVTQTMPHDSPGTLVFCCWRYRQNSKGVTPNRGAKCRWVG